MSIFKRKTNRETEKWSLRTMFGPGLSFAVAESYKLLRTNVMFSFPDEDKCRVVGVTSAVQSEGKSSTSCNLCYALAEAGKRVLLLEADLRRPSVASKLMLERTPGLTNLLVSKGSDYRTMIQHCRLAPQMDVLVAGSMPPNPSELLGSARMERVLAELSNDYEYIVVDLPPVTAVSDAVAISRLLDGIIMVVRNGVAEQRPLAEAMRQLKMVNVRILGFVYRESVESNKRYGKYGSKYYRRYYNNDYAHSAKREKSVK